MDLFLSAHRPDVYNRAVISEINKLSPSGLDRLLQFADNATKNSNYLMSIGPLSTDRTKPERKSASPCVLGECCKRVLKNQVEEMRELYDTLRSEPTTSTAASMVFEHRVHQFLQEKRVIDLFPILGHISTQGKNVVYDDYTATGNEACRNRVALPVLKEVIFTDKTGTTLEVNTYYCVRSVKFPAIGSWLLAQPIPRNPLSSSHFRLHSTWKSMMQKGAAWKRWTS
jgi:hypothetical protein